MINKSGLLKDNSSELTVAPNNNASLGFLGATYFDIRFDHPKENLNVISSWKSEQRLGTSSS